VWTIGNPWTEVGERVVIDVKARKREVCNNPVYQGHNRDHLVYYMDQLHPVPTMGALLNFTVNSHKVNVHFVGVD